MKQITAVCPGSFDPVTLGHLDIISRASAMFDRVLVVVMSNPEKKPCFSVEERMDMLHMAISAANGIKNTQIDTYTGLLANYVREKNASAIVKGLRAVSDFEYEFQMALTNEKLNPRAETVFLTTRSENMYLSSSIVRAVGSMGGDISDFVPPVIHDAIKKRLIKNRTLL